MDNRTPLHKAIDRLLQREAAEYGPAEVGGEGVLLEWRGTLYDSSDYGTQDKERRLRPIVDDDLVGWERLT